MNIADYERSPRNRKFSLSDDWVWRDLIPQLRWPLLFFQILRLLNKRYGGLYTEQNFILSATHTHGTPGGHVMDLLFDISSLGFVQEVFDALLSGIVKVGLLLRTLILNNMCVCGLQEFAL